MKTLEYILSDFNSLQKTLLHNFDYEETAYNFFEPKEKNKNDFFRRVFIDGGLEVWILSAQFDENILLEQHKSSSVFYAIHFFDW